MADLTVDASKVAPVYVVEQYTAPAADVITAGMAVAVDTDGNLAPASDPAHGISVQNANVANLAITMVTKGLVDVGDALDSMAFGDSVYVGTGGVLADDGTVAVGQVWPGSGSTNVDKILKVEL